MFKINSNNVLRELRFSINITSESESFLIHLKDCTINLNEVNVIWYWRWHQYDINELYKWEESESKIRHFINEEIERISQFLFRYNSNIYVLGNRFINKIEVLLRAKSIGILIPNTVVTQTKDELVFFYYQNKSIIVKPISNPIFIYEEDRTLATYTKMLSRDDIETIPDTCFPVLAQKYIDKDFEIRSFYIDGFFYSSAIISQCDDMTKIDFRNYNLDKPNRVVPFNLPTEIETKLIKLFNLLKIETCSIDVILNNGEYYLLDINPVGQYDMVSYPCNYELSEVIANHLILKDKV